MHLVKLTQYEVDEPSITAQSLLVNPDDISHVRVMEGPDEIVSTILFKGGEKIWVWEPICDLVHIFDGSAAALSKLNRARDRRSSMFQACNDVWKMLYAQGYKALEDEEDAEYDRLFQKVETAEGETTHIKLLITLAASDDADCFDVYERDLDPRVGLVGFYSAHKGTLYVYKVAKILARTLGAGGIRKVYPKASAASLIGILKDVEDTGICPHLGSGRLIRNTSGAEVRVLDPRIFTP